MDRAKLRVRVEVRAWIQAPINYCDKRKSRGK